MGNAELRKIVETRWQVGRVSRMSRVRGADVNSRNLLVKAGGRQYLLKKDVSVSQRRLQRMARVLRWGMNQGMRMPEIIPSAKGRLVERGGYMLFRFVKGKVFSGSVQEMASLARELARLHRVLATCRVPYPAKRANAGLYAPLSFRELKRMKRVPALPVLLAASALLAKRKSSSGPRHLIHGDLQPGNVLFEGNRVSLILDFGGMHRENPWGEVAFAAFRFGLALSGKRAIRTDVLRFARAYAHERHLSIPSFEELRLHFVAETFARASYILRQQNETGTSAWARDFSKQVNFLRLVLRYK